MALDIRDTELATEVSSNMVNFCMYLAKRTIDNTHLSEEPKLVIAALTDLANEASSKGLDQVTSAIVGPFGNIEQLGFDNNDESLLIMLAMMLEKIGVNAAKFDNRESLTAVINGFYSICHQSMQRDYNDSGPQAHIGLLIVGVAASEYNLKNYMEIAAEFFGRLAKIMGRRSVLMMLKHMQDIRYHDNPHFMAFIKRFDPSLKIPLTTEDIMGI
jgi:hypothetical protein